MTALEILPRCAQHGQMRLRSRPDKMAAELGTWYDCPHPHCVNSVLLAAPWLVEQYERAGVAR